MLSREDKRRAFYIVMNGFMERYAAEIIGPGMSDARLTECIQRMMQFRLIWGGPGRFSGRCQPDGLKIWAGPTPLEQFASPVLAGDEVLRMTRAEYEIADPTATQLALF